MNKLAVFRWLFVTKKKTKTAVLLMFQEYSFELLLLLSDEVTYKDYHCQSDSLSS